MTEINVGRARCRALVFVSSLAVGALAGASNTWAQPSPVDHCGQELDQAGDYYLPNDLGPCSGHGVVITATNVRFTLAGHTLSGVSGGESCDIENPQTGIAVQAPGATISGGTVTGFWDGITLTPASRVTGMRVEGNCSNGVIVSGNGQVDTTVVTDNGNDGIALCPGKNAIVTGNDVLGSSRYGISLSCGDAGTGDGNQILRNILRGNGKPGGDGGGIAVFGGNNQTIAGNSASGNLIGVYLITTTGSTVRDNVTNGNRDAGIVLTGGAHGTAVRGNTAFHNARVDMQDDNPGCVTNTWWTNFFVTDIVAGSPDGGPMVPCLR